MSLKQLPAQPWRQYGYRTVYDLVRRQEFMLIFKIKPPVFQTSDHTSPTHARANAHKTQFSSIAYLAVIRAQKSNCSDQINKTEVGAPSSRWNQSLIIKFVQPTRHEQSNECGHKYGHQLWDCCSQRLKSTKQFTEAVAALCVDNKMLLGGKEKMHKIKPPETVVAVVSRRWDGLVAFDLAGSPQPRWGLSRKIKWTDSFCCFTHHSFISCFLPSSSSYLCCTASFCYPPSLPP